MNNIELIDNIISLCKNYREYINHSSLSENENNLYKALQDGVDILELLTQKSPWDDICDFVNSLSDKEIMYIRNAYNKGFNVKMFKNLGVDNCDSFKVECFSDTDDLDLLIYSSPKKLIEILKKDCAIEYLELYREYLL